MARIVIRPLSLCNNVSINHASVCSLHLNHPSLIFVKLYEIGIGYCELELKGDLSP